MKITAEQIKKVRDATGAPIAKVKKVLEEQKGDEKKAAEILVKEGHERMAKRAGRETGQGVVFTYQHHSGKVASMVELLCETDFVAKNEIFAALAKDIAMQVASMSPKNIEELEKQAFIKDPKKKIKDLVSAAKTKTGENIKIGRIERFAIGD